jgi:ABC-type transport system substrate-binding protein
LALAVLAGLALAACTPKVRDTLPPPSTSSTTATTAVPRPRGGSVRVGVWGMPDPAAPTQAGAGVRALVLPQLFTAGPKGEWRPSLVAPGSDRLAADGRSASFALRAGARWTSGAAIGAGDLRRSADARFVDGVDGPDGEGRITVRFKQRLPGWQRLWSGVDSVSPPGPGVWGGPFTVVSVTPGLEAVLRRNESWWGGPGPNLDEVRLVLVPDVLMTRQLFDAGQLDVVSPPAYTARRAQYGAAASGGAAGPSGWTVQLVGSPKLDERVRRAVAASVERDRFVGTLLAGEASVDKAWGGVPNGLEGWRPRTVQVTGQVEEPMTATLERSMQKKAVAAGGTLEPRNAEADRVEAWLAAGQFDAAVALAYEGPVPCWSCRWSGVDAALARAADEGDAAAASALAAKLRDTGLLVPLWRLDPFVAVRPGVRGVIANGYGLNAAWNAWEWWRA